MDDGKTRARKRAKWMEVLVALVPALVVVIAYRTSPSFGLIGDAHDLIEANPSMWDLSSLWQQISRDYFWTSDGGSIGYWRPLTKGSWLIETAVGNGAAVVYHLVQVAWFAAGAVGVVALGRALRLSLTSSLLAGLLFALHPAAIEPVCLVMARSDLVVTTGVIWAAFAWLRWRDTGQKRWILAHVAALVVAFASKEAAIVSLPLFVLWSALEGDYKSGRRKSLRTLLPVVSASLVYVVLRSWALGASSGADISLNPSRILAGLGFYLRGLLPFRLETGVRNMTTEEVASGRVVLVFIVALAITAMLFLWCAIRWRKIGLVLTAWTFGSLLLVLIMGKMRVPGGAEVLALSDRWMLQAAAASSLFFLWGLEAVERPAVTRLGKGVLALWCVVALWLAADLHGPYKDNVSYFVIEDQHYEQTPPEYRTPRLECRYAKRRLIESAAADDLEGAMVAFESMAPPCQQDQETRLNLLAHLVERAAYSDAADVLVATRDGVDFDTDPPELRYLTGEVLLNTGRAEEALSHLRIAGEAGYSGCAGRLALARALGETGAHLEAARSFEGVIVCERDRVGEFPPSLALAAANLYVLASSLDDALRLMSSVDPDHLSEQERALYRWIRERLQEDAANP